MKKWYLVFLILFTVSVLALPPPPPAPGGFGNPNKQTEPTNEVPKISVPSSSGDTTPGDLQGRVVELEKKIEEIESQSIVLTGPYLYLLISNLFLLFAFFYIFFKMQPPQTS